MDYHLFAKLVEEELEYLAPFDLGVYEPRLMKAGAALVILQDYIAEQIEDEQKERHHEIF